MTIQSELAAISQTAEAIKDAIREKGQTVLDTDSWMDLVPKINAIPNEGGSFSVDALRQVLEGTISALYDDSLYYLRPNCFRGCTSFSQARFKRLQKICQNAFKDCTNFEKLTLESPEMVKLDSTNAFEGTRLNGIYVPEALVQTYQNDPMWENYNIYIYWLIKGLFDFYGNKHDSWTQPTLTAAGTQGSNQFAVAASSQNSTAYQPWQAFNTSYTGNGQCWATSAAPTEAAPQWISWYYPKKLCVTNIEITNRTGTANACTSPSAGKVQGSNDNTNWEDLTTFTNTDDSWGLVWNIPLTNNKKCFKYHRLYITARNGSAAYTCIQQINLTATKVTENSVVASNVNTYSGDYIAKVFKSLQDVSQTQAQYNTLDTYYENNQELYQYNKAYFDFYKGKYRNVTTLGTINYENNRIASNWNTGNYLRSTKITEGNVVKFIAKVYPTAFANSYSIFNPANDSNQRSFVWGFRSGGKLGVWNSNAWTNGATTYVVNTWIWTCLVFDNATRAFQMYGLNDNGYTIDTLPPLSEWTLEVSNTSTLAQTLTNFTIDIGNTRGATGEYFRGSIDLENCYCYVDDVVCWRGIELTDNETTAQFYDMVAENVENYNGTFTYRELNHKTDELLTTYKRRDFQSSIIEAISS